MALHATVEVDHVTVYCKALTQLNDVFKALGFFTRDGKHYMFRKNYLEGYAPGEGEHYDFFPSDGGLHALIFWSDDPDGGYQRLTQAGYEMAMPVTDFSRPAEKDGEAHTAVFRGAYLSTVLFPLGESALVKQVTPDLIYLEHPAPHANTVWAMEELYLCLPADKQAQVAKKLEETCMLIRGDAPLHTCVNDLTCSEENAYFEEFHVRVDPARSNVTGIRFSVEDMAAARECIARSGLNWHELGKRVVVDASEQLNLFLVFSQR